MKDYLQLKWLSLYRLFKDIPFVGKAVLLIAAAFLGYALYSLKVDFQVKPIIVLAALQFAVCYLIAPPPAKETTLLLTLRIPLWKIRMLRIAAASTPFFLINPLIAVAGTLLSLLLAPAKNHKWEARRAPITRPVPFSKSSYRWIAAFRRGVLPIVAVGLAMSVISCIYGNLNMSYAATIVIVCLPCFFSTYREEPLSFLRAYLNTKQLLLRKIKENLYNSFILLILTLPAALFWASKGEWGLLLALPAFAVGNLLIEWLFYLCYPMFLLAIILSVGLAITLSIIAAHLPMLMVAAVFLIILLFVCLIAYYNLKSVLYEQH